MNFLFGVTRSALERSPFNFRNSIQIANALVSANDYERYTFMKVIKTQGVSPHRTGSP
jgi:hypothetical protein